MMDAVTIEQEIAAKQEFQKAWLLALDERDADRAEINELKTQIKGLQLIAAPGFSPNVEALAILLARQEVRASDAESERDVLRNALLSLVDGKSEFDIEYDTGMDIAEARRIMDLAHNRE